jgi:hypothetical protein
MTGFGQICSPLQENPWVAGLISDFGCPEYHQRRVMANLPKMARVIIGNGWVTGQEFADGFALGQFVPGPNMLARLLA